MYLCLLIDFCYKIIQLIKASSISYLILIVAICDRLCENPSCSCANFDLRIFTISKCYNSNIIWGSIVKISVSVQKFPCFILVQRNQNSVALSGLYSCFCEDA